MTDEELVADWLRLRSDLAGLIAESRVAMARGFMGDETRVAEADRVVGEMNLTAKRLKQTDQELVRRQGRRVP